METIGNPDLKAYAIWEPILRTDNERAARRATTLLADDRVEHFWSPNTSIGIAFQKPIELTGEPAWDVYLVYPKGALWGEGTPPKPIYFMHQLGGRLPNDPGLDGDKLAERVKEELSKQK